MQQVWLQLKKKPKLNLIEICQKRWINLCFVDILITAINENMRQDKKTGTPKKSYLFSWKQKI